MSTRTGDAFAGRRSLLLLVALLGLAPALGAAAGAVEARIAPRALAQDERLRLTIRAEAEAQPPRLDPPAADFDFEIVDRSQSQQTSMTFAGGVVQARHAVEWELTLAPRRAGTLTIPSFWVTIGPDKHATTPFTVKVAAPGGRARLAPSPRAQPAPPGAAWRGWERDLWLEVQVDRVRPWMGEQVTASVFLVSPVGVIGIEGFKPPAYDGFWAEPLEIPRQLEPRRRTVNGIPLMAFLVQRIALFPTRAGKLVIAPFQADVTVQVLSGNRLFDPFRSVEQVRRRSAAVELDVRPLPAGAPPGFESVNVGGLALELTTSERTLPAGEPLALRLTARGEGNVRAWSLPPLPPIAGTRRFAPTSSEQLAASRGHVAGSRTVETLLVPERAGELVIPPVSLPWFDVKSGRYQIARTAELRVPITGGAAGAASAPIAAALTAELRPIRSGDALARRGAPPWGGALFALLLLVPPGGFAALLASERLRERARRDAPARRVRGAVRSARRRLSAAARRLRAGDAPGFVGEVERALTGYAADKLGRPVTGLRRDALAAALAGAGAHPPAVRALLAALEACDEARFGGAAPGEPLLAAAADAMVLLEEADWTAGAGERA
jgi:hypothetical protein